MNSEGCKCIKQVDCFLTVCINAVAYTLENISVLCRRCFPLSCSLLYFFLEISTLLLFLPCVHMCSRGRMFGLSVSLFVSPPLFELDVFKCSLYTK